jgi:uncharacterized protein YaeQ
MAQGTVLYRFRLNVSDVDRGFYERLDFRMALHPSESIPFLLTRMLAYALNAGPGVAFSAEGLCNPDDPAISSDSPMGGKDLWIEIGSPSGRRLHKAAKAANKVKVYTYKNLDPLLNEIRAEQVHKREQIEVFTLAEEFLSELEGLLDRDNEWEVFRDQGSLMISSKAGSVSGDLGGPYFGT